MKRYNQEPPSLDGERALLDTLLAESRLYRTGSAYRELLDFVARLRHFAPFNAVLLHIQKPGMQYAASAQDWQQRFGRYVKEGARPLLILWPFGPVALVYDVDDTEGARLPDRVLHPFIASGEVSDWLMRRLDEVLHRQGVTIHWLAAGQGSAGSLSVEQHPSDPKEKTQYKIVINTNHPPPVQFATLAHELGHLFLGHLGADRHLKVSARLGLEHWQEEIEAESVAYMVCHRHGVTPNSEAYLADFAAFDSRAGRLDLYQVMRAAGQVEKFMGIDSRSWHEF